MPHSSTKIARKDHSCLADRSDVISYAGPIGAAALCVGAALWIASALGLDPTNVPQRQDFERFHLPSLLAFANRPFLDALADYPAAPFPLFYVLAGWIYREAGSALAVQAATVGLAGVLLLCVFVLARERFGASWPQALLVLAIVLASPYFRGQSVYANTDILALLFAFAAIWAFRAGTTPRFFRARAMAALALACLAVYTRQFYLFLPAYLFIRICAQMTWRACIPVAACAAVLGVPAILLVALWGGVTPPRFQEHAMAPSLDGSVPAVILLLSFYAMPLAVVTAWRHRDAFVRDLQRPAMQMAITPFLLLGAYLLLRGEGVPEVVGGGIPLHALRSLPVSEWAKGTILAIGVVAGGTYLAYVVRQDVLRNVLVVLIMVCFFPTGILYQRYFDPLMPLVYTIVLSTREMSARSRQAALVLTLLLEFAVAGLGFIHYHTVFWSGPS